MSVCVPAYMGRIRWVAAWRDGSAWKRGFMAKNPGSVYVEIENYYVKMLSGWRGQPGEHLSEQHLERAKETLRRFDVVLLSDWMADDTQVDAMNAVRMIKSITHSPSYNSISSIKFMPLSSILLGFAGQCNL